MTAVSVWRFAPVWRLLAMFAAATACIFMMLPVAAQSLDVEVGTPAVTVIKKSIAQRFALLKPHLDAGAIGLTQDGLLAVHDFNRVALPDRAGIEALVTDDNKDRSTLYREIARANGHPDWETDLRATFGRRWFGRAPSGWYYRDGAGAWTRKP